MPFDFYQQDTVVNIPPQEYLIKPVLPEGLSLLSAKPKEGKSLVALDWVMCLGTGLPWRGLTTQQVAVLYILSEARGTLPGRVLAWHALHGRHPAEITFACGFSNLEDYKQVIKDLKVHIPEDGLIVWDTLARNMQRDESDSTAMGAVVRTCDLIYERWHTSSLLVHHSTKEQKLTAAGKPFSSSYYRGHSSLLGAVDIGMTIEDGELVCKDSRHDEPFEPIALPRKSIYVPKLDRNSVVLDLRHENREVAYR